VITSYYATFLKRQLPEMQHFMHSDFRTVGVLHYRNKAKQQESFKSTPFPNYLGPIYQSMDLQPFVGPWPHFHFLDLLTQSVGFLGRGISQSQGRYLHKHRINAH
jgi:hypothetical protein